MEILLGVLLNYIIVQDMREETQKAYDEIAKDMAINHRLTKELEEQLQYCRGRGNPNEE